MSIFILDNFLDLVKQALDLIFGHEGIWFTRLGMTLP